MFSRGNQEPKIDKTPLVDELIINDVDEINRVTTNEILTDELRSEIELEIEQEESPTVKLVEKISSILSPYFIVIVGLYLYDRNFIFGNILILIGILSLLKISYDDIWGGVDKVKVLLTKDDLID